MSDAIERVAAACLASPFKDDRHVWEQVSGFAGTVWTPPYEVRRCKYCRLVIFTRASSSTYSDRAPKRGEIILHAFFEEVTCPFPRP